MASTLDRVVARVADVLTLVDRYLTGPERLLRLLGWEPPPGVTDIGLAAVDLSIVLDQVDTLRRIQVSGTDEEIAAAFARLTLDVADGLDRLRRAAAGFTATPDYLSRTNIVEEFFPRLLDMVVLQSVARLSPTAFAAGQLAGILVVEPHDADPPNFQTEHLRHVVRWDRIGTALRDPGRLMREVYGWGSPGFDAAALIANIGGLLQLASVSTRRRSLPARAEHQLSGQPVPDGAKPSLQIMASVVKGLGLDDLDVGLSLFGLHPTTQGGADGGIGVTPYLRGTTDLSFPLADRLAFTVDSTIDLDGGIALILRPDRDPQLKTDLNRLVDGATAAAGKLVLAIRTEAESGAALVLLDLPQAVRLEAKALSVGGSVRSGQPAVTLALEGGHLVIDASGSDGFIGAVLGDAKIEGTFDLTASFSPGTGLQLGGSGGLALQLPLHTSLGPVTFEQLYIALGTAAEGVQLELSAGLSASLGPVRAVVERVGMKAELTFPDGGGNLGPAELTFGFKPPNGVGLSLDAGVIAGGGFLSFDAERGEYAGALELELADFLAVKAIGLITTRQPDGRPGFSLLLVLTAEFPTGLQLGAGFTLLAVGGLVGLNRGMNLQALVEGVSSGAIESVAFPKDVVANAPRILSDLGRFFPVEEGTFLVGPMVKIGWGTPTLISISLGVIVEIPGDIAVLGVVRAALPTADKPLLLVQAQFVGALELSKSRAWFFAKLFQSRIMGMTVEGAMGVLVAWGGSRELIVSVGGFHPSFRPPPLPFPVPNRLAVPLLNRGGQLVRLTGYFAITSNTIQFGGDVEVRLGFSAFRVEGHLGVDGLIQRSPFRFTAHTGGDVSLKVFGIGVFTLGLDFTLEGPAPFRAHGRGSIGFLFFSVSADFDITWGEVLDVFLPLVSVLDLLAAEFDKPEGWETRLPSGETRSLVNLRALPATDDLVLHPLGTLVITQRAVPLNVRVDRVGGQKASDGKRFSIGPADGSPLERLSVTGDKFAMAQFQDMSDAAKLSRPSYETQDAGLELTAAGGALATARVVRRAARYELHVIGDDAETVSARAAVPARAAGTPLKRFHSVPVFDELRPGSSTSRAPLSARQARQKQPFAAQDTVRIDEQRFVVAYVRSNRQAFPRSKPNQPRVAATFRSRATAEDALTDFVTDDPTLAGRLHVIPVAEAAISPGAPGTWLPAGTLRTPVSTVDMATLPSGAVLIAGGTDAAGAPTAATALFDPTGDSWADGPSLGVARQHHTTTPLLGGQVLVAGGSDLASAEVFDPAGRRWTPTPAMVAARHGHSATRLKDGRVLVAGGRGALTSAELYDPKTGTWTETGSMTDARTDHQAVLLADDRVLVIGGALPTGGDGAAPMAYCEVYDPKTREWTPTGTLHQPRAGHQAVVLLDDRVLVTGGDPVLAPDGTLDPHSLATAELYDPKTETWQVAPPMPGGGRSGHRALTLRSGVVLLTGGTGAPERTAGYRSVLAFDPLGTWSTLDGLITGRSAHAMTELADDRVLVAAGADTGEVLIP